MLDRTLFKELLKEFKNKGEIALTMSHYDLAKATTVKDPHIWKLFLIEPEISDWINEEIALLEDIELKKLIHGIAQSNSVGKAQLINALSRRGEGQTFKEGPIFIYTYIPLNTDQEQAPNVVKLNFDPFLKNKLC